MAWKIEFERTAAREFRKLDTQARIRIRDYLVNRVLTRADPRELGKALRERLGSMWRFRVGPYRIICVLKDTERTVLIIRIGHRREVYR